MSDKLPCMEDGITSTATFNPIHELMRAMVLRAVEDYHSGNLEDKENAIAYMEDLSEEYVLSFSFICKHLGMDPKKTKDAIIGATHRISTRRRAA